MHSAKHIRWSGLLAMVGGVIWTGSWILSHFTEDCTRAVLGLSECGWSRMRDPAMLFFMAGLVGFYARQAGKTGKLGKTGFIIGLAGLGTMLIGNVIEFWVGALLYADVPGEFKPTDHLGWAIVIVGFVVVSIGFILLGVATLRAKVLPGWRGALPLIIGLMITSGMLLAFGIGEAGLVISFLSFGLGWLVLGYVLWSDRSEQKAA